MGFKRHAAKRKAESEPAEEMEESVDKKEDVEDSPFGWTDPQWGEDSSEGRGYNSPPEQFLVNPEHERLWRRCERQLIESKGFYLEPELIPWATYTKLVPVCDSESLDSSTGFNKTRRQYFTEMACLCLKTYNEKEGSSVEFVEVVRGFYSKGPRSKSYITFMAREKPDGPPV
ncbi:unnamed protein product [Microthlaspi erraticum]|uniref:Uncharacterized protein n=1 Tax=Microthlaspi erraticum TaxID=1685480 RepID=A0A6D2HHS7_9BRAS|nr:unnamed protein product [Microthlaspi erraticum]